MISPRPFLVPDSGRSPCSHQVASSAKLAATVSRSRRRARRDRTATPAGEVDRHRLPARLTEPDDLPIRTHLTAYGAQRLPAYGLQCDVEPPLRVLDRGDGRRAELAQPCSAPAGAGHGRDLRARSDGEFGEIVPHPAAGAGDQDSAADQRAHVAQQSEGRQPGQGQGRSRGRVDAAGQLGKRRSGHGHLFGPAGVRGVTHNAASESRSGPVRGRGEHRARDVFAGSPILPGAVQLVDLAAIDREGRDRDHDLARCRGRLGDLLDPDTPAPSATIAFIVLPPARSGHLMAPACGKYLLVVSRHQFVL